MAQELIERLRSGQWVALLGGPGLGKTRLATSVLAELPDVVTVGPGEAPPSDLRGKTVFCDDLGRLEAPMVELVVQRLGGAAPKAVMLTGGRALRRLLPRLPRHHRLRPFPIGVLREQEAREWVREHVAPRHVATLLARSGHHPFLTQRLLECWDAQDADPITEAVRRAVEVCASFCVSVARQVRAGAESALLDFLVLDGGLVPLDEAARAVGQQRIAAAADVLAMLGVVRQIQVDGERAVHAGCGLLNDWWVVDRRLR